MAQVQETATIPGRETMAMADEPLVSKTIQCPACQQQVPFRIANPRLFTVAAREADRHVTAYRWRQDLVTTVVPHRYDVWQCARCLYADLAEAVDQDEPSLSDAVRQEFEDIPVERHMVLDALRELVPAEGEMDQQGAIASHLAAILITSLPTAEAQVDHAKLGRLAQRLAWLYREQESPGAPGPEPRSQTMGALAEATERLDRLLTEAGDALQEIRREGQRRTQELARPEAPESNPYHALGDMIDLRLKALHAEVTTLQMAVLQDQHGRLAQPGPLAKAGSLEEALLALTPLWPELPRSERQSLRLALEACEYTYRFEAEDEGVEQGVPQGNLILDLLIRLGELERALDWASRISKQASDSIADLKERLANAKASKTLSNYDGTVISRKVAALSLAQQGALESRRDILELMLARDREKIDAILGQAVLSPPERLKALAGMGFHEGVLALVSREVANAPKEKTGWFKGWLQS